MFNSLNCPNNKYKSFKVVSTQFFYASFKTHFFLKLYVYVFKQTFNIKLSTI